MDMNNRKNSIIHLFAIFVIIGLCCVNIQKLDYIAVLNDEFGYWSNAVSLAGYDWSSLIAETPYYSLGYSLFLVPIITVFHSPELWYKAAILLNIFFLILSYFLCCAVGKKFFSDIDTKIIYFVSLLTIIYPGNIAYAQVAWSESLLYLLVWCATYCIIRLEEEFSWKFFFLTIFFVVFSYFVHARGIGLIIVGIVCLILVVVRHKKSKWFLLFLPILVGGGYIVVKQITKIQVELLWSNSDLSNMNQLSVNSGTIVTYIKGLFDNFRLFCESLGGKLLYLVIGTGLTFFCSVCFFCETIFTNIKKRKVWEKHFIFQFWYIGIIVAMWFLSSLQMLDWHSRKDIIVYSRYMEYALGPVLLCGVIIAVNKIKILRYACIFSLLLSAIGIRSVYYRVDEANNFFNTICSPVVGAFYDNITDARKAFVWIFIVCLVYFLVLIGGTIIKKPYFKEAIIISTFIIIFSVIGYGASKYMNNARDRFIASTLPLKKVVDSRDNLEIYYVKDIEHDTYSSNPKYLQFMIPDRGFQVIKKNSIEDIEQEEYLIMVNPLDIQTIEYIDGLKGSEHLESTEMLNLYIVGE